MIPCGKRGRGDPETVSLLQRASAECFCVELDYGEGEESGPRLYCPDTLGHKGGHRKVLGVQVGGHSRSGIDKHPERCLFVPGINWVRRAEAAWESFHGDVFRDDCFDAGNIDEFSWCLGDPERTRAPRWR
jgi:hypothetical protein